MPKAASNIPFITENHTPYVNFLILFFFIIGILLYSIIGREQLTGGIELFFHNRKTIIL